MSVKRNFALGIMIGLLAVHVGYAQTTIVGPAKGSLVVVGGNMQDERIVKRIIELAGGPDELIVIIPTAGGGSDYDQHPSGLRQWKAAGAKNLFVLHTYDHNVADTEKFVEPLKKASGVFFEGGRQWRLADAYLNTRTHRELQALLDRGGVIGGSSAGATIIGSFMVRGDTKGNEVMLGDHQVGLGFLKNVAVYQHVLKRNRQFDMLDVIKVHPELLGIAIDEDTAIVVQGDQFDVMGKSYALIYDNQRQISPIGLFYFLTVGDRYNMATREATRPTQTMQPIERIKKSPWSK